MGSLLNFKNFFVYSKKYNKLLDLAKGKYIALMNHDDEMKKERLKKQYEFLEKSYHPPGSPHCDLLCAGHGSDHLRLENDRILFLDDGAEVAYFSNRKLYVTDTQILHSLQLGNFAFMPRDNGNLSFKKI